MAHRCKQQVLARSAPALARPSLTIPGCVLRRAVLLVSVVAISAGVLAAGARAGTVAASSHSMCTTPQYGRAACTATVRVNPRTGQPVTFARHHDVRDDVAPASQAPQTVTDAPPATLGTPQYIEQAYDLTSLALTRGYGETIGIVVVDAGYANAARDLAQYRSDFGLPACSIDTGCLRIIDVAHRSSDQRQSRRAAAGWGFETALDLDAVSAACPNCSILLVEAASETVASLNAAERTAYRLGADVISNSWVEYWHFGANAFRFPDVAVVASAGDYGYVSGPYRTPYPASAPTVTAVGGTRLLDGPVPSARGVNETGARWDSSACSAVPAPRWQHDAGGCSTRAVADVAADGDAASGLFVYYSADGTAPTGYTGGGTSLAAALVAGYYGLLGSRWGDGGAAWAYGLEGHSLNDVTVGNNSGPNGACAGTQIAMCTAGPGYDGITGVGSISGAIVAGPPGVARGSDCGCLDDPGSYVTRLGLNSVTVSGGVYPNSAPTQYWWEYGRAGDAQQSTAPVDIGPGGAPVSVSTTIAGLDDPGTYHFTLVASNRYGTVAYGQAGFRLNVVPARRHAIVPRITFLTHPGSRPHATVSFRATGDLRRLVCRLDGHAIACPTGSIVLRHLRAGVHALRVTAIGVGRSSRASVSWKTGLTARRPAAPAPAGAARAGRRASRGSARRRPGGAAG